MAVVGGGLAGLSTAVELLDQGYDVEIYEQRPFIGGKVLSSYSCSFCRVELLRLSEGHRVTQTCLCIYTYTMFGIYASTVRILHVSQYRPLGDL